jgi:hypothetical protein
MYRKDFFVFGRFFDKLGEGILCFVGSMSYSIVIHFHVVQKGGWPARISDHITATGGCQQ